MPDRGLSPRLQAAVDALPFAPGMRVLEIGCGPGAASQRRWVRAVGCSSTAVIRCGRST